ncbi:Ig-like domain-containing protein [Oceanirhabdus sp. W0125-5]|uniref:Ig-like domain-containing protein n=1 Tax=Oceanirhabdus sp. W0125-5 TaxID=2999116 RepID=UPI0022F2ACA8|nr:Ig-like domain-containing protein [Oceanirhabdus sp. W0125-5]WBW96627.1 Ig-like domain-containing protein [Oceanirhabdus sp. W0125-5]
MAIETFVPGTLIIPMEEQFQDNGMWLAYGLVYRLLQNSIPVKWAIQPGKLFDGTDFTASAIDIQTFASISGHNYKGGPFIIDSAFASAALPIINAWQSSFPDTTVHQATVGFSAPIAATMNRAPRIAVEENNSGIIFDYLDEANIPDSLGLPWDKDDSPGVLSSEEIGNGAFFGFNEDDPCKQKAYDIFLSPHASESNWEDPVNVAQLDLFLRIGGFLHATCASISAIENIAGPFLTVSGIPDFPNDGDEGTFTVDVGDYPSTQAVTTSLAVQKLPGGSEQTWLNSDVVYNAATRVLAHFTEDGEQYDFMVGGSYKNGTGSGKIVYEGGHSYSTDLPYSENFEGPYLRFLYDSIFFSVAKPNVLLDITPASVPQGGTTTSTFDFINNGGSNAENLTLTITLEPWAVYNVDATITPTSITTGGGGETILFWDSTALAGNNGPGTIVSFTANVTPPLVGKQQAASFSASFNDNFGDSVSLDYCESLNATAGASPNVTKTPTTQSVNPNDIIPWTITVSNNGILPLNNVVVTDTLPAGLTFISSVPAPTSISGGGGSPTILTWTTPAITDPLPPLGSFVITLNAQAPAATTASFNNNVVVTGDDTSPASYSVSADAVVDVNNRPPTVTLISPNGGEVICNQTNITWTASDPDGDPLTYTLSYSSNGGISYTEIVSGISTTSYTWITSTLPSGSNYLVKVVASDGELTGQDISDGPFTIDTSPPSVNWVFPANGQLLTTSPVNLQAQAVDNVVVTQVTFQYSLDGITFTTIGIDTIPSGDIYTRNWETDGLPVGDYILRAIAQDGCGRTSQDDIQVTVSAVPEITVVSPNGGEVFCSSPVDITWSLSDPSAVGIVYTVQYSSNNGTTFNTIATGITTTSYSWNTSALPSGNKYLIKIIATDGITTKSDVSDGPFTIDNTPPTVFFVLPIDGSTINTLSTTLRVSAIDNVGIDNVLFQYSIDGITFVDIATETVPIGGFYQTTWNLTGLTQGNYIVRATAEDTCGKTGFDEVNVLFNIPPTVTVISPNGGEVICPEGTTITWVGESIDGGTLTYNLYYSANNGATYILIASGLTTSSFFWDTSGLPSGDKYLIKVVASDGLSTAEDVSDAPFTIDNDPPTVNIINPAAGSIVSSSPVLVQATASDNVGVVSVTFQYSPDGITFITIGTDTLPVGNVYSANWNLTGLVQGDYVLRAIAEDTCGQTTTSEIDVIFNIPPTITVVAPNGGEIICPEGITITWEAENPDGGPLTYTVLYSPDGGVTFNLLATGLTVKSFFWDTSGLPSGDNYVIKVIASDGIEESEDVSDEPFTIDNDPPTVSWISPLNGDFIRNTATLIAEAYDNVSVDSVVFSYSSDGGITFINIGTVTTPSEDKYALPFNTALLSDGQYILRVTANDECNNSDYSDINVIIDNTPPVVDILAPPDGSTVDGLVPLVISASDNECLAQVDLYIDGELVDTQILNNVDSVEYVFEWNTEEYFEGEHTVKAVATDCAGLVSETENTYVVDNLPECYTQILINGTVEIPAQKPDLEKILNFEVDPIVENIRQISTIAGNKFIISGSVDMHLTYVADEPEQSVHFAHFTKPFSTNVVCPNIPLGTTVEPVIIIEHVQWHKVDERKVSKYIALFIGIKPVE